LSGNYPSEKNIVRKILFLNFADKTNHRLPITNYETNFINNMHFDGTHGLYQKHQKDVQNR
jgi:hypothetical protein